MADAAHKDDAPSGPTPAPAGATVTELPRTHYRGRHVVRGMVRFLLMVVVPVALVIYGATLWAGSLRYVTTENAYVKANLVAISADVSGRVIEVNVRENEVVDRGAVLFRIDPRDYQFEVDARLAELEAMRHEILSLRAEYRGGLLEIEELTERIAYLQREQARAERLAERGVGTTKQLDEAEHNLALAQRELATREENARMILAELGGRASGELIEHPRYQKELAELDHAQLDLDRTTILAPARGTVSNVRLRLGEFVEAGTPVFSMIELPDYWIEANLKETQLTHVRLGQSAELVADAYPDVTFQARIESISPATGAEFALLPPQNASGNWVKVVQRVPVRLLVDEQPGQPRLRAGMTVTVRIDTERERTLGLVIADGLRDWGLDGYVPGFVMGWLTA